MNTIKHGRRRVAALTVLAVLVMGVVLAIGLSNAVRPPSTPGETLTRPNSPSASIGTASAIATPPASAPAAPPSSGKAGVSSTTKALPETDPAQTPPAPVTVVVLPARLRQPDPKAVEPAQVLCDLLAQSLATAHVATVVNRTELERVVEESKRGSSTAPKKSFEAMIRIELDTLRPAPKVTISVIDLSHGNEAASESYDWKGKPAPEQVQAMTVLCTRGLAALGGPRQNRRTVRYLGFPSGGPQGRLTVVAETIGRHIERLIDSSPAMCRVRHLEALSSQEESLFLLMGLTRMSGRKEFVPQSDATVELRVKELDAEGKTFEQTPIEVSWRADAKPGASWQNISGVAGKADELSRTLWSRLADAITATPVAAAQDQFDALANRTRQARAEIEAHQDWNHPNLTPKRQAALLSAAATAVKLDPLYEQAVFQLLRMRYASFPALPLIDPQEGKKRIVQGHALLEQALRYLHQFPQTGDHRSQAIQIAYSAGHWAALSARIGSDKRLGAILDGLKDVVDIALAEPVGSHAIWELHTAVRNIYGAMLDADCPPAAALAWRNSSMKRHRNRLLQAKEQGRFPGERSYWTVYQSLCLTELRLAVEEGNDESAETIIRSLMETVPREHRPCVSQDWKNVMLLLFTADLQDEFAQWRNTPDEDAGIVPYAVPWPAPQADWAKDVPKINALRPNEGAALMVLASEGDRTYVLLGTPDRPYAVFNRDLVWAKVKLQNVPILRPRAVSGSTEGFGQLIPRTFGYIPLDGEGRPSGDFVKLPQPPLSEDALFAPACTCVVNGKIYLGLHQHGIAVYDPVAQSWQLFAKGQGMPAEMVCQMFPQGKDTLLCIGVDSESRDVFFTFNTRTSEMTLLRRGSQENRFWEVFAVWPSGDRLMGLNHVGLISNLLDPSSALKGRWPQATPQGWPGRSTVKTLVELKGRRFLGDTLGLWEIDDTARILRGWGTSHPLVYTPAPHPFQRFNTTCQIPCAYPQFPIERVQLMGHDGQLLYVKLVQDISGSLDLLAGYDPATDTWYGPFHVQPVWKSNEIGKGPGAWTTEGFICRSDIQSAAAKSSLTATTDALMKRRQSFFDSALPLDQAKYLFGLRQFDKAATILKGVLKSSPREVDALLLMGMIYEPSAMNDVKLSEKYYLQAAAMKDRPDVAAAGLYHAYALYIRTGSTEKAIETGKKLLSQYSLYRPYRQAVAAQNAALATEAIRR